MSRRDNYGGIYHLTIGAAVFLAAFIVYRIVSGWWSNWDAVSYREPPPPAAAPQQDPPAVIAPAVTRLRGGTPASKPSGPTVTPASAPMPDMPTPAKKPPIDVPPPQTRAADPKKP